MGVGEAVEGWATVEMERDLHKERVATEIERALGMVERMREMAKEGEEEWWMVEEFTNMVDAAFADAMVA